MAQLKAENISKIFKVGTVKITALHDINFTVQAGEFLAIMGKSGSGKSTLMNIMGCLDIPTKGNYFIDNINTSYMSPDTLAATRNKKIGFIFQQFNLLPNLTALENVALPQLYAGKTESEAFARAQEILTLVELKPWLNHYPSQLSGGQQQRVAIARGLVNNPDVILADEPTGNLDSKSGEHIMHIFSQLNKEKNITVIIVTHDADLAAQTRRTIVLHDGRIIKDE